MSVENNELPKGWVWTRVGGIYDIVGGGTPSTNIEEYWKGDIAWVTSADIYDLKDIRPRKLITKSAIENSTTNLVPEGSLIVVTRVGLGKVALTKMPICFSQDAQALIGDCSSIYPDYSLYYLAQAVQVFKYQNRGTTIAGVTKKQLSELPFSLPPLAEQHRIVAAIEQQFTRLDAGVAALRRAQTKLKRYRAAVLKAAVEGKLTETWRTEHPTTEPASTLLERILKERHARWEADLKAKGKDPTKVKYIEPAKPDTESLPELPEGWCWVIMEQLITYLRNGLPQKPESSPPGHRILRINAVRPMSVNLDEVRYLPLSEKETSGYFLDDGDILFTRYNGSLELLGVAGMVRSCFLPTLHPDKLIRVKTALAEPLSSYIEKASNVGVSRAYIESKARTTAGQTGISGSDIKQIPIPLPPLDEQEQIVAEVEQRLSVIAQLEALIQANLKRAERLRQSILKEAFAWRLVPQDPDDEPASVLLERIRKERDRRKRETASNGRYLHVPDEPVQKIHVEGTQQAGLWENVGGG